RKALSRLDLRNSLVSAAWNAEAIYVTPPKEGRKVLTCLAHIHALRADLVTIKHNFRLRLIELHIGVGVNEDAALHRIKHKLLGETHQLLRLRSRCDNEINREISSAR